ncbi:J domain-containing protein isoform X1 [Lucilia cuprina]|nr:J domain-containing protein isoform X1 [Lucilia cuprina]XP_023292105.1 J domain-containing protein isoform X1 [Lucilia cuprina]XP_037812166.1 J domain-containing protein isoform X1 [Lucilia sericata]XP_037812167.1 J domain-containing protein isoform X1 [Lucilia sericata]XP_037812168.1 J domain-containing protein isoform X1 [Lucilia sericata]KAI8119471.1 J domain-containing protein [Lucilia cuprina]KAI8119472.1 J domain-containing protein [Lucilia cuprina]
MSAVDSIINFKRDPNEDFYGMLNCDENSSIEQIQAEYKVLALQYHPDKNSGDKDAEAKFQKLKEAKETLCDPEKRANYDKWRNSGIAMSYKNWLGMKEHVGQVRRYTIAEKVDKESMHWATPKTKDRMLPETAAAAGAGGSGGLSAASPNPAHRRASEGGAALYYGGRKQEWGTDNSDVANKFRNYEI